MTPLPFHCPRMRADFLSAPCRELGKVRGECEGCPDAETVAKTDRETPSAARKWNTMPRAPKVKKPATVKPAPPVVESKVKSERHCRNCGFHVGPNWSYCRPCTQARQKWGDQPTVLDQVLKDIRRRRSAGEIRKGRKPNDGGMHKGGIRKKSIDSKML